MRKLISLFIITLLFSCNTKEQYYGDWIYDWVPSTVYGDIPSRITITKDSIKLRYPYFDYWSSFPVKLSSSSIEFNDIKFKTKFIEDTLVLNKHFKLIKPKSNIEDSVILREDNMINIDLPKLDHNFDKLNISNHYSLIRYGKRIDNGEYTLNLNDKFTDFKELPRFLIANHQRHEHNETILFFCDKEAKLKEFEKMIFWFQSSNKLKISLVNKIILKIGEFEPFYGYETLNIKLPPLIEKDNYFSTILGFPLPPPPPLPPYPSFIKEFNYIILKLIKNKIYNNEKELGAEELENLVNSSIKENKVIISLYDLESNYSSFMKMNSIISKCYKNLRNEKSLKTYNKSFNELSIKSKYSIKKAIPNFQIWNYSIPHFNSLIRENGDFLGLKTDTIKIDAL